MRRLSGPTFLALRWDWESIYDNIRISLAVFSIYEGWSYTDLKVLPVKKTNHALLRIPTTGRAKCLPMLGSLKT